MPQRRNFTPVPKFGLQGRSIPPGAVVVLDDKENGRLIAKGHIPYDAAPFSPGTDFSGYFEMMLSIEVKDDKYRYGVEDLAHVAYKNGFSRGSLMKR